MNMSYTKTNFTIDNKSNYIKITITDTNYSTKKYLNWINWYSQTMDIYYQY